MMEGMRSRHWLAPLALVALALALRAWTARADATATGPATAGGVRVQPFIEEAPEFAALTIEYPRRGERFLVVPSRGRWRSYTAFGAPLLRGSVEALTSKLLSAHGVPRSDGEALHASYRLEPPALRLTLHGPGVLKDEDRDVLAAFAIGATVNTATGAVSYAQRLAHDAEGALHAEDPTIWEIAFDPRPELQREESSSMPPMLDQRLVPGPWPGSLEAHFRYFEIAGRHGTYRLVRRETDGEDGGEDAQPWHWTLEDAEGSHPCSWSRVETYSAFLRLAPYIGLEDPQRAALYGIERPYLSLRAWPVVGDEPLEIYLGDAADKVAGRFCLNLSERLLCVITDQTAAALDPAPELFLGESLPEPWSMFLEFAAKLQAGRK